MPWKKPPDTTWLHGSVNDCQLGSIRADGHDGPWVVVSCGGVELYTLLEINVDLVDGFPSMDQETSGDVTGKGGKMVPSGELT